jgi:hypothetical protein
MDMQVVLDLRARNRFISLKDAAKELGCSARKLQMTVWEWERVMGKSLRWSPRVKIDANRAVELARTGKTAKQIAGELRCSAYQIGVILREHEAKTGERVARGRGKRLPSTTVKRKRIRHKRYCSCESCVKARELERELRTKRVCGTLDPDYAKTLTDSLYRATSRDSDFLG